MVGYSQFAQLSIMVQCLFIFSGSFVRPILVVFHHLAEHNCKISTPTDRRLSDRSLVDHCTAIVDVVFWDGSVYQCEANEKAREKLAHALTWRVSMQQIHALKSSVCRN